MLNHPIETPKKNWLFGVPGMYVTVPSDLVKLFMFNGHPLIGKGKAILAFFGHIVTLDVG